MKDVPFVDLWKAFQNYSAWNTKILLIDEIKVEINLPDRIYLCLKAYEIFYEELLGTKELNYTEFNIYNLLLYFPIHEDNNYNIIEESILGTINQSVV